MGIKEYSVVELYNVMKIKLAVLQQHPENPLAFLIGYIEGLESELKIHNPKITTLPEKLKL